MGTMKGPIVILLVLVFIPSCKDLQSNDLPFNSDKWKAGDTRLRGRMESSLYRSRNELLIGKTQPEIRELMGEPDMIFQDECGPSLITYSYKFATGTVFDGWFIRIAIHVIFNDKTGKAAQVNYLDY